jgi:hypothetical protein
MLGRLYGVDAVTSIAGPIMRRIDSTLGWRELYGGVRRTFDVAFVSWGWAATTGIASTGALLESRISWCAASR